MEELYHWTEKNNLESIRLNGLLKNGSGFLYLTKFPEKWVGICDKGVLLKVKVPEGIRLSCFEDFLDGTEILCWGNIPKENITFYL